MKKYIAVVLALVLIIGTFAACTSKPVEENTETEKLQIVTTIFPEYDWVMNILGDKADTAEVTMLLDNGVDLHSYQPTATDIMKIASCDVFIYVGGESDGWVDDALKEATNTDMAVVNLMDVLADSIKEEEVVEGMEKHEHEHEEGEETHEEGEETHEEGEEHEQEHETEYDEHVWLSLKSSATAVTAISKAIETADPENSKVYVENRDAYLAKINALDAQYAEAVKAGSLNTLLFGDRFPFRYMVDDYGLDYYAAFVGCSAETEASFETVKFLAEKVDELSLHTVITLEGSDQKIANTIIQNTETKDQQILTMNSMQSTTSKDVQEGASYLAIMEGNLEILKEALK